MLWIFWSEGTVGVIEIVLLYFSVVLRSLVISIKYGYLPKSEIDYMKKKIRSETEMR